MNMIETSNLQKVFRIPRGRNTGPSQIEAVKGITLHVQQGEIFGFLGPNGAGKTTTLRMLTTLLPPTAGGAVIAGYDLIREPKRIRMQIGYVSQTGGTDRGATARENLELQARLFGLARSKAKSRAAELLAALELENLADRPAQTYSGGQRRRLDLALGLIHQPALLFLDEPTSGLDPQSRAWLWDELRRLRGEGITIFMTTHYLNEADELADRLTIIDHGQVVAEGTPIDLKRQIAGDIVKAELDLPANHSVQVSVMFENQQFVREIEVNQNHLLLHVKQGEKDLPEILRLLDRAGIRIRSLEISRPTLDDVFLRKTGRSLRESAN